MHPLIILLIGMAVVLGGVLVFRLHAFVALVLAALTVSLLTPAEAVRQSYLQPIEVKREVTAADQKAADALAGKLAGEHIADGFGKTAAGIGILIAMAAIIGKCLLDSGAADRIVRSAMRLFGEKGAPLAFVTSGFTLGVPVFFDTVFYLMVPLGKAMHVRTGKHYLLYILSIVAGATMAHSLVPPTPGPLLVAGELGVAVGHMMIGGLIVGVIAVSAGYAYAVWADRRWAIPMRETDSGDEKSEPGPGAGEVKEMGGGAGSMQAPPVVVRDEASLPPLWLALTPILLPVVLIAGESVLDLSFKGVAEADLPRWWAASQPTIALLANKNIALTLAAIIALGMLAVYHPSRRKGRLAAAVQAALMSGGVIILITAAGGAFGHVLRQTNIAGEMKALTPATGLIVLPMAFLITTLVRTAQGSATVAMITAVGIVSPLAAELPFHPVYLALAIGCGSKPISWMNDSGFWIIGRMSGFTEGETLRTATVMMALMGVVGLAATMVGAVVWPMGS